MNFEEILAKAKKKAINEHEALFLFENTASSLENTLKLFDVASYVRNNEAGKLIRMDGFIGGIAPCDFDPPCGYCFRHLSEFEQLTKEELTEGVKAIAKTGTTTVELGGGTSLKSARLIKEAVKIVQENSDMEIWINVGPCLSEGDVKELKQMGVKGITCSLETINENVFKKVKSEDSLEKRKELIQIIDKHGVELHSVLMVGLQESFKDRVDHMFYLKQFKNLKWFLVTWLHSPPTSPVEKMHQPSPLEAARAVAIARLIFRDIYTHVSGWQHLQLWLMAGCNRFVHAGTGIHKRNNKAGRLPGHGGHIPVDAEITEINDKVKVTNLLPVTARYVEEMGLELEPSVKEANLEVKFEMELSV